MSAENPNLVPAEDASIHDNDPTHPRGNKELAEEMARAGKAMMDLGGGRENPGQFWLNHAQDNGVDTHTYEKNARDAAKQTRIFKEGAEVEEAEVRQAYLEAHPELVKAAEAAKRELGEKSAAFPDEDDESLLAEEEANREDLEQGRRGEMYNS